MKIKILSLIFIFNLCVSSAFAIDDNDTDPQKKPATWEITSSIFKGQNVMLSGWVKYHEGDIEGAHTTDFDDSDWDFWESMWYNPKEDISGWDGIRWYRHYIRVDSSMFEKTVAMNKMVFGASEVWLNGELISKNGVVSADQEIFEYGNVRNWLPVQLGADSIQVLAIRHANPRRDFFKRSFFYIGLTISFSDLKSSRDTAVSNHRFISGIQWFIVGFCLVFAIIHLLFFLFNRKLIFNLWFSITCFAYVFGSWVQQEFYFYNSVETIIRLQLIMQSAMLISFAFITLFLYSVLKLRLPLYFKILFSISLIGAGLHALNLFLNPLIILLAILLGIQIIFVSIQAIRSGIDGSWLLGGGVVLFILSVFLVLGLELSGIYMTDVGFSIFHSPYIGFGMALVAMSVYQSRHLAKLNLDLTRHLREVKELSEKNLESERSIREAELQRVRLETENERKTAELEKARSLQLSLLPSKLPETDDYSIHAAMFTASEVGGDYYDFITKTDGTTIWTVGDATGHGTEAGFLAAMTKTLFQTLAPKLPSDDCLREMSAILKDAGLRKKFMCLGLLHIQNENISWCSAGIPAAIIHRSASGQTELLESKGMPLATALNFPFQITESILQKGDVILLFSDGLMEQMNPNREQFGMDRISHCLQKFGSEDPEKIVAELMNCLVTWREIEPQQDDISLVCLKKK